MLAPHLLEKAVTCGLRGLFVGFETLDQGNLAAQRKFQNRRRDYDAATRRLHDLGVHEIASGDPRHRGAQLDRLPGRSCMGSPWA